MIDFSAQSSSVLFSLQLKTDSEKRSATDEPWESTEELKKPEEDFDSHGDGAGKWKGVSSGLPEDPEKEALNHLFLLYKLLIMSSVSHLPSSAQHSGFKRTCLAHTSPLLLSTLPGT